MQGPKFKEKKCFLIKKTTITSYNDKCMKRRNYQTFYYDLAISSFQFNSDFWNSPFSKSTFSQFHLYFMRSFYTDFLSPKYCRNNLENLKSVQNTFIQNLLVNCWWNRLLIAPRVHALQFKVVRKSRVP